MSYEFSIGENVDRTIGAQIRQRRIMMGLTQDQLAETLGISYQQVQKYETGSNRVSASRLFEIANLLETDIGWFFPLNDGQNGAEAIDNASPRHVIELVRRFSSIENQKVRAGIMALVRSIAENDDNLEELGHSRTGVDAA
ncbi:MAG: helix-turn-helix domain-containing protein [Pseudomonadota bacterium]